MAFKLPLPEGMSAGDALGILGKNGYAAQPINHAEFRPGKQPLWYTHYVYANDATVPLGAVLEREIHVFSDLTEAGKIRVLIDSYPKK